MIHPIATLESELHVVIRVKRMLALGLKHVYRRSAQDRIITPQLNAGLVHFDSDHIQTRDIGTASHAQGSFSLAFYLCIYIYVLRATRNQDVHRNYYACACARYVIQMLRNNMGCGNFEILLCIVVFFFLIAADNSPSS